MYSNRFTRENPGLIVFLVDQSGSTEDIMSIDGHTIADHIADLVNACITEAIKQATIQTSDDEEEVKHEICFVIIGYGGKGNPDDEKDEGNWKAELLMAPKYSDVISEEYEYQKSAISNLDILPILTPAHGGGTPMASAYMTAYNVLKQWNQSHDGEKDPVPVIINISDGEPTDNTADLRKAIEDIKSLQTADGSPLIINLHISAKPNAKELKAPSNIEDCYDEYSKLMFEISTEVTDDIVNNSEPIQRLGISQGGRLFCSNIKDPAYAGQFVSIGTRVKMK